jgi:hypothetical protein
MTKDLLRSNAGAERLCLSFIKDNPVWIIIAYIYKEINMVPTKDNEVRTWSDNFIYQCETHYNEWGLPKDAVTPLRLLWDAYDATLATAPDTRSKSSYTRRVA